MTVVEALNYFEYNDINEAAEDKDIKRRYKKLMRKYHPDLAHGNAELERKHTEISKNINEALEVINLVIKQIKAFKAIEEASNTQSIFAIIPFESLFEIYNNKTIQLSSKLANGDNFTLNKSNIRAHKIILHLNCDLVVNGIRQSYSVLTPWVIKDEYSINCPIIVTDMEPIDVIINCHTKNVELTLKNNSTRLKLQFESGVVVYVNIEKKLQSDDKE